MKRTASSMIDSPRIGSKSTRIDGFRFDLMGIHDVRTMNAIWEAMDALDEAAHENDVISVCSLEVTVLTNT